jgi:peptidoglycan/xylan/chitin deacetylase (PgdA/CDA1 family)
MGIIRLFYFFNKKQRILTYHHILPDDLIENNLVFGYTHSISSFKAQLKVLVKRFQCVTDFGKKNTAVITFDDGVLNNYIYALPFLRQYNIKAYFFIVDSLVGNQDLLWSEKWVLWLSQVPYGKYTIGGIEISIRNEEDRMTAHTKLWRYLTKHYDERDKIIGAMEQSYSFEHLQEYVKNKSHRFSSMSEKEIELLKQEGHFIGAHSVYHDILSLQNKDELERDCLHIKQSTRYNTRAFAIPFGGDSHITNTVISILEQYEFTPVLVNEVSPKYTQCLGRINLPNTSNKYIIEANLSGLHHFITSFISIIIKTLE